MPISPLKPYSKHSELEDKSKKTPEQLKNTRIKPITDDNDKLTKTYQEIQELSKIIKRNQKLLALKACNLAQLGKLGEAIEIISSVHDECKSYPLSKIAPLFIRFENSVEKAKETLSSVKEQKDQDSARYRMCEELLKKENIDDSAEIAQGISSSSSQVEIFYKIVKKAAELGDAEKSQKIINCFVVNDHAQAEANGEFYRNTARKVVCKVLIEQRESEGARTIANSITDAEMKNEINSLLVRQ